MAFYTFWNGGGLALTVLVALGLLDVWATPEKQFRKGSKTLWFSVMIIPVAGLVLWAILARPKTRRPPKRVGPRHRASRSRADLHVVEGAGRAGPDATAPALIERQNAEIERTKELNRRLAEWERQNGQRTGEQPPSSRPLSPAEPELSRPDAEAAVQPVENARNRSSASQAQPADELSDEELAATLEKWRAEFDG